MKKGSKIVGIIAIIYGLLASSVIIAVFAYFGIIVVGLAITVLIIGEFILILGCKTLRAAGGINISILDLNIWITIPLSLILFPFIKELLLGSKEWFYDMSISFSLIIIIYIGFYIYQKRKHLDKYLALMPMLIFQLFAWFLILLGGPIEYIPWVASIRNQISDNGLLTTIVLLQGSCGVYMYLLGDKLNKLFLRGSSQEYINQLQYIVPMIPLFPILESIATLVTPATPLLRLTLSTSSFLLGILSIASGIVLGCRPNVLLLLGGLFNFCINFIVGAMIIHFAEIGVYSFPIVMAFFLNSSLLTGLVCYLGSDRDSFLFTFIQLFLMEKRNDEFCSCYAL